MSGLFDQLRFELKKRHRQEGIRPADLLALPLFQRRVRRCLSDKEVTAVLISG